MSFRKTVTHLKVKVWEYNKKKDVYTGWHANKYGREDIDTQVDHVVECQIGEDIWENALDGRMTTRNRLRNVVQLWNAVDNLNITQTEINLKKGQAVKAWKKDPVLCLNDALYGYNVAINQRAKICVAFEDRAKTLSRQLDDLETASNCVVYGNMASELDKWIMRT